MGYSIGDVVTFNHNKDQRFGRVKGFKLPQKTASIGPTGLLHGKVSHIIVNMWNQHPAYSCDVATETLDLESSKLRKSSENAYDLSKIPKMKEIKAPTDINNEIDTYIKISYPIKSPYSNSKKKSIKVFGVEFEQYVLTSNNNHETKQSLKDYGLTKLSNGNFYLEFPKENQGEFILKSDNKLDFETYFSKVTGIHWDSLLYITAIPWGSESL